MRVGIFGGAFNPPHKMHKEIAIKLIEKNYLDKVIYVPTGNNYNKPGLLDGKDRINMLNLLVNEYNEKCKKIKDGKNIIEISDFEVQGSLYTINTLKHFKEIYPNDEIYFICGTDNLVEFNTWRDYEDILKNYKLLVIARKDNEFNDIIKMYLKYEKNIVLANIEMQVISSTMVRKEILENGYTEKLNQYLDEKIINYLKTINVSEVWDVDRKSKCEV